jgi:hypothetical protein
VSINGYNVMKNIIFILLLLLQILKAQAQPEITIERSVDFSFEEAVNIRFGPVRLGLLPQSNLSSKAVAFKSF